MKKIIFITLSVGITYNAFAQQWGGVTTQTGAIRRSGIVGIGSAFATPSLPLAQLHVSSNNPNLQPLLLESNIPGQANTLQISFGSNPAPGINVNAGSIIFGGGNTNSDMLFMPNSTKPGLILKDNGNVGLGVTSPMANLDILQSAPNSEASLYVRTLSNATAKLFAINNLGSYGFLIDDKAIGHIASNINATQYPAMLSWDGNGNFLFGDQNMNAAIPTNKVTIKGDLNVLGNLNTTVANFSSNNNGPFGYNTIFNTNQDLTKAIAINNSGTETFRIFGNGLMQINHQTTGGNDNAFEIINSADSKVNFKVKNNGFVYAREVTVTLNAFPDYVFDSQYKLASLSEVRNYIKSNHRLMNMPSAKEVESNGANIGEIQKVTVEKLEEAYLYILQLEDKIEALNKRIETIEKK